MTDLAKTAAAIEAETAEHLTRAEQARAAATEAEAEAAARAETAHRAELVKGNNTKLASVMAEIGTAITPLANEPSTPS